MEIAGARASIAHAGPPPKEAAAIQHLAGLLWYEMLSELNKTGFDSDTLGTGGDDFQSMFLWNVAQNDFGKYDTGLLSAIGRQVGGVADMAPAAPPVAPAAEPDFGGPVLAAMQLGDMAASGAAAEVTGSAPQAPPANLAAQAKQFAQAVWPQISAAAQVLGVPAVAMLAQSALETGWGTAAPGHNLFGIKAAYGQAGTSRATHEMVDGVLVPQTARFKDYASNAASVADYVGLLQGGFPAALGQPSVAGFAQALQLGGYATDRNYAVKIVNISQSRLMQAALAGLAPPPPQATAKTPTTAKTGAP